MADPSLSLLRSVQLAPDPRSVRRAREVVAEALTLGGHDEFTDIATLLVSELVTNAVLHARTDVGVTVAVTGRGVRIEVSDHSPHLPSRRHYDEVAITGRGLELVELLAETFGVESSGAGGKTVWFTLGTTPQDADAADGERATDPYVGGRRNERRAVVRLLNLPRPLFGIWQQRADALLREYTLFCYGDELASAAALEELGVAHQAFSELVESADPLLGAAQEGRIDLALEIDAGTVAHYAVLSHVLDHASDLAAQGYLLVPAAQPEVVAMRRWVTSEVLEQNRGRQPEPWTHEANPDAPPPGESPAFDTSMVHADARAVIAADDANRIIAVSPSAAELLGWPLENLEGRRLLTIIPPRLREAHIVGFVGHLLSGQTHIIGREVAVEALHSDGSEIPVLLHIERQSAPGARLVFLAELRPLPPRRS